VPILDNGQWVDENHPLYLEEQKRKQGQQQPQPVTGGIDVAAPAPAPAAQPSAMTPAQAAAAGLGWVPVGHPLYGTPGYVGSQGAAPGTPGAAPGPDPTQGAQTISATPGAPPSNATTNQGTQDVVRNTYLQQIQKGTAVDTNDPNFRQQADTYAAAQERARRNAIDDTTQSAFAGGAGAYGGGAQALAQRAATEGAARNVGQFEASLVGQELQNRRDEIKNALSSLGGMISNDQQLALQRELASLDAALKRESLAQTGSLGAQDISLRDKLGTGALNVDLIRALLQNQQFGNELGFNIGQADFDARMRAAGF
jgi:hypothetical protein